ncbi:MAG: DUF3857 domain-containing protein [Terriglobales bacterium]
MKYPAVLLLCGLLCGVSAVAQAPQAAGAPPAAAQQAFVVLQQITHQTFNSDGTGTRSVQVSFQVESEAGVKELAVISLPYTQGYQTIQVDYVRVKQADGTVVTTPPSNIRSLPAAVSLQAPMYSDLMQEQIVVRGLQVGATLDYKLEVHQVKAIVPGQFWFGFNVIREVICKDQELSLTVPADRAVIVSSPGLTPVVSVSGGEKTYAWHRSNPAPAKPSTSAALPPPPSVQATTFPSWAAVGAWYNQLQQPELTVTPAIRAKADALVHSVSGDDARIQTLYDFVSEQIHYVSIPFGIGRFQPHAADDVLSNGYGDCKDKSTLLAALLKVEGYTAWPALVNVTQSVDLSVPSPAQFDHVVTVVQRTGGSMEWLDPTVGVAPAGWLSPLLRGQPALLVVPGASDHTVTIPVQSPVYSDASFVLTGAMSAAGTLAAHVNYTFTGDGAVVMRAALAALAPAQWQQLVQGFVGSIGFAGKVSDVSVAAAANIEKPLVLSYDYRREKYPSWTTNQMTPPLPVMALPAWSDQGKSSVIGLDPHLVTARCRVTLPSGYSLTPTPDTHISDDFATYDATYSFRNGLYTAERSLRYLLKSVPATEKANYEKFTATLNGDTDVWTNIATASNALSPQQRSHELMGTGWQEVLNRQYQVAETTLKEATASDPTNHWAWNDLGVAEMDQSEYASAEQAFRQAIAADPQESKAYDNLGRVLSAEGKEAQADVEFRKQVEVGPTSRDEIDLGVELVRERQFAEAVPQLKRAITLGDNPTAEYSLGQADVGVHDFTGATVAWGKAVLMHPSPGWENDIAYQMAGAGFGLEQAQQFADKAIATLNLEFAGAQLQGLTAVEAGDVQLLGDCWDTLGWIYFRQGDLTQAASYLAAAWQLTGDPHIADHLGQVYEKQGHKREAERLYAQVAGFGNNGVEHARQRLRALAGSEMAAQALISQNAGDQSQGRTVAIPRLAPGKVTAQLLLSFSPGAAGKVQLDDAVEASGDPLPGKLKTLLAGVKFPVLLPGPHVPRLIEGGAVYCASGAVGCSLVLSLPTAATQP